MAPELAALIAFLCNDTPVMNREACQKAAEAYLIQSGASETYGKIRSNVDSQISKSQKNAITGAAVAGKYLATRRITHRIKITDKLQLRIDLNDKNKDVTNSLIFTVNF